MRKDKRLGFDTALLVSPYVIAGAFVLSLLAWWGGLDAVAALLLAVAAVGLVSRLWGEGALRRLEVSVTCESGHLSVGQTATLRYTIENKKALPLVWLELCQSLPARGCMSPEGGFRRVEYSAEQREYTGREGAYVRRFAFLMGWRSLSWACVWRGEKRGVYRPEGLLVRSGDGFGITESSAQSPALDGQVFAVWPELVDVDASALLRDIWSGETGRAGWAEDPSVMRGERLYQPSDPWKRIDWRTAARTEELYVRQFETILPQSILFVFDSAALADAEEAISLLGSLILELSARGVRCGLALPRTNNAPMQLLRPDDPAVGSEELMFALADFDAETAESGGFDIRALTSAASAVGRVYMIGQEKAALAAGKLAMALESSGLRYLCREPGGGLCFDELRRKGAAG